MANNPERSTPQLALIPKLLLWTLLLASSAYGYMIIDQTLNNASEIVVVISSVLLTLVLVGQAVAMTERRRWLRLFIILGSCLVTYFLLVKSAAKPGQDSTAESMHELGIYASAFLLMIFVSIALEPVKETWARRPQFRALQFGLNITVALILISFESRFLIKLWSAKSHEQIRDSVAMFLNAGLAVYLFAFARRLLPITVFRASGRQAGPTG